MRWVVMTITVAIFLGCRTDAKKADKAEVDFKPLEITNGKKELEHLKFTYSAPPGGMSFSASFDFKYQKYEFDAFAATHPPRVCEGDGDFTKINGELIKQALKKIKVEKIKGDPDNEGYDTWIDLDDKKIFLTSCHQAGSCLFVQESKCGIIIAIKDVLGNLKNCDENINHLLDRCLQ